MVKMWDGNIEVAQKQLPDNKPISILNGHIALSVKFSQGSEKHENLSLQSELSEDVEVVKDQQD